MPHNKKKKNKQTVDVEHVAALSPRHTRSGYRLGDKSTASSSKSTNDNESDEDYAQSLSEDTDEDELDNNSESSANDSREKKSKLSSKVKAKHEGKNPYSSVEKSNGNVLQTKKLKPVALPSNPAPKLKRKRKKDIFNPTGRIQNNAVAMKLTSRLEAGAETIEIQKQVNKLLHKFLNKKKNVIDNDDKEQIKKIINCLERLPNQDGKPIIKRSLENLLNNDKQEISIYKLEAENVIQLLKEFPDSIEKTQIEILLGEFTNLREIMLFLYSKQMLRDIILWTEIALEKFGYNIEIAQLYKNTFNEALKHEISLAHDPDNSEKEISNTRDSNNIYICHDSEAAYHLFRLITKIIPDIRKENIKLACQSDNIHFMKKVIDDSLDNQIDKSLGISWKSDVSSLNAHELLNIAIECKAKKTSAYLARKMYVSVHPLIYGQCTLIAKVYCDKSKQQLNKLGRYFESAEQLQLAIKHNLLDTVYTILGGEALQIMRRYDPNTAKILSEEKEQLRLAADVIKKTIMEIIEERLLNEQQLAEQINQVTRYEYIDQQLNEVLSTCRDRSGIRKFHYLGEIMSYILQPQLLSKMLKKDRNGIWQVKANTVVVRKYDQKHQEALTNNEDNAVSAILTIGSITISKTYNAWQ